MLPSLFMIAWLTGAAPAPSPAGPPSAAQPRPITAIVLDASAVDAELAAELSLRAAGRELLASNALTELPAARFVWLSVRWIDDAHAQLEIVGTDGRAYDREVTAPPEQLRRAIAGTAANMLAAIERGEITPDRSGVALPQPEPIEPAASPVTEPIVAEHPLPPAPAPAAPPRWELGPRASGGVVIGLGPPLDLDGLVAAGGGLGLDARHQSGALLGLHVRGSTHARAGLRLVRVRVAISAGHSLRRGRFELLSRLGLAVEPIILREHGSRGQPRGVDGAPADTVPLVGVLAGLSPGVLLQPRAGGPRLRLSLELELGAAMEARPSPGAVRYLDDGGDAPVGALRAGGVELGIGLGVGGWFGLR